MKPLVLKIQLLNDLRRFSSKVPDNEFTFDYLLKESEDHFGNHIAKYNVRFSYVDDEGDNINVLNTLELQEAIRLSRDQNKILKLSLYLMEEKLVTCHDTITPQINKVEQIKVQETKDVKTYTEKNINNSTNNIIGAKVDREKKITNDFCTNFLNEEKKQKKEKKISENTYDLFSNLSSRVAQNVSASSNNVSQKMKEQITNESKKATNNSYKISSDQYEVSQIFQKVHLKANNFVDSACKEEKKNSAENTKDYDEFFDTIKKISDKTTEFVKNLAIVVDNNVKDFCDYTYDSLKDK
eukprot:TRINITY_DN861_c0_g1_i1.p1 TRINITY_DN861_c0_g1~~TRINITY_DN861_c0_g1_i1.p1  ORF type:complete len:297 (-),score=73.27 TRINITY_DN861_c0_g1_i1:87-977(-)